MTCEECCVFTDLYPTLSRVFEESRRQHCTRRHKLQRDRVETSASGSACWNKWRRGFDPNRRAHAVYRIGQFRQFCRCKCHLMSVVSCNDVAHSYRPLLRIAVCPGAWTRPKARRELLRSHRSHQREYGFILGRKSNSCFSKTPAFVLFSSCAILNVTNAIPPLARLRVTGAHSCLGSRVVPGRLQRHATSNHDVLRRATVTGDLLHKRGSSLYSVGVAWSGRGVRWQG